MEIEKDFLVGTAHTMQLKATAETFATVAIFVPLPHFLFVLVDALIVLSLGAMSRLLAMSLSHARIWRLCYESALTFSPQLLFFP